MINLNESYVARLGFELAIPGLKSDYKDEALPTASPGTTGILHSNNKFFSQ